MDITSVIGNNSWKFRDDTIKKVWRTDRRTDRQPDWTIHRAAWSQLKSLYIWFSHFTLTETHQCWNYSLSLYFNKQGKSEGFESCDRPIVRKRDLGQNRLCFVPCDLEIWWMTLENNRASLLCGFKLCATFHSHWWIQTGVTVRKRPIWVKFDNF